MYLARCLAKSKNPVNVSYYIILPCIDVLLDQSPIARKAPIQVFAQFFQYGKNISICPLWARHRAGCCVYLFAFAAIWHFSRSRDHIYTGLEWIPMSKPAWFLKKNWKEKIHFGIFSQRKSGTHTGTLQKQQKSLFIGPVEMLIWLDKYPKGQSSGCQVVWVGKREPWNGDLIGQSYISNCGRENKDLLKMTTS